MIIVNIAFKEVEILKYARGEPLLLRISFNDGKERSIIKTTNLENTETFTQEIMAESRKLAKEQNSKNTGNFLDDTVQVRFGDDEEKTEEKLYQLFSRIKEDVRKMRNPGQNILQKIAMMQGSKYNF